MALLTPGFLIEHPIRSGLIWAALFVLCVALLDWMFLSGSLDSLPGLVVRAVLAGLAWGYAMRWWHKRKIDRAG